MGWGGVGLEGRERAGTYVNALEPDGDVRDEGHGRA